MIRSLARPLSLVVLMLFQPVFGEEDIRTNGSKNTPEKAVSVQAELENLFGLVYVVEVDLGALESNSEYDIELLIKNPFDREFQISKLEPNCTCTKPVLDRLSVPANGSAVLRWKLHTQSPAKASRRDTVVSSQIKMFAKDPNEIRLDARFKYSFSGALEFFDRYTMIGVPLGDESEFRIPFVSTPPVNVAELRTGQKTLD